MHYRSDIDGLRAFSVLTVLLFHLDFSWISGGFIGVDTFFVISGYLITGILIKKCAAGTFSFADFYMRRVKRIFPALFTMLTFTLILGFFFLEPEMFKNMVKDAGVAGLQFSNFRFAEKVDYFQQSQLPSVVLHTWSLGVEEQFYLIWPILIWFSFKLGLGRKAHYVLGAIFVVSLGLNIALIDVYPRSTFYLLHTRAWELALGGLVALYHFHGGAMGLNKKGVVNGLGIVALAVLLGCSLFYTEDHFPGMKAVLPCVAAALLIHLGRAQEGVVYKALSLKPVVFVGLISYGLYLWHWPLIVVYKSYTSQNLVLLSQLALGAVAFALTLLSYYLIEKPLRYSSLSAGKTLLVGFLVMGIFFGITSLARKLDYHAIRIDAPMTKDTHFRYSQLAKRCNYGAEIKESEICELGDPHGSQVALLSGDSHAGHYIDLIHAWGKKNGVRVRVLTKDGCQAWLVSPDSKNFERSQGCRAAQKHFQDFIERDGRVYDYAIFAVRSDKVKSLFNGHEDAVNIGYVSMMRTSLMKAQSYARDIVFMGQVPVYSYNPVNCYYAKHLHMSKLFYDVEKESRACLLFDEEYSHTILAGVKRLDLEVTRELGASYFDPVPPLYALNDGQPFYKDNDHLTPAGSLALLPSFTEFMKGVMAE